MYSIIGQNEEYEFSYYLLNFHQKMRTKMSGLLRVMFVCFKIQMYSCIGQNEEYEFSYYLLNFYQKIHPKQIQVLMG